MKLICRLIVWVSLYGRIDYKGLVQCASKKETSRIIRYIFEDAVNQIRLENNRNGGNISSVFFGRHARFIDETNLQQTRYKVYFLNALIISRHVSILIILICCLN